MKKVLQLSIDPLNSLASENSQPSNCVYTSITPDCNMKSSRASSPGFYKMSPVQNFFPFKPYSTSWIASSLMPQKYSTFSKVLFKNNLLLSLQLYIPSFKQFIRCGKSNTIFLKLYLVILAIVLYFLDTTCAVRLHSYMSDISPKQSPGRRDLLYDSPVMSLSLILITSTSPLERMNRSVVSSKCFIIMSSGYFNSVDRYTTIFLMIFNSKV